ncbi:helix-turn-helix domain-containing protein [Paenibacillus tuaregi]|uniref:helix-turn-helix domain-containing protein n=1 Tax=Paenibacillus tuaregi TaxID=1816681 RepID=UPI000839207F|nr:helix-turn-helix transcriptional regulator [Paenibacillus tuaregi]
MDLSQEIGANIKKYRKAINMTTTELGALSGTSQSTISQIEKGRSTNIETLIHICTALKVTLSELLPAHVLFTGNDNADRKQLQGVLDELSDSEIKAVLTMLTTDIIPALKSITPFVKIIEGLDPKERDLLTTLFYSLANK